MRILCSPSSTTIACRLTIAGWPRLLRDPRTPNGILQSSLSPLNGINLSRKGPEMTSCTTSRGPNPSNPPHRCIKMPKTPTHSLPSPPATQHRQLPHGNEQSLGEHQFRSKHPKDRPFFLRPLGVTRQANRLPLNRLQNWQLRSTPSRRFLFGLALLPSQKHLSAPINASQHPGHYPRLIQRLQRTSQRRLTGRRSASHGRSRTSHPLPGVGRRTAPPHVHQTIRPPSFLPTHQLGHLRRISPQTTL